MGMESVRMKKCCFRASLYTGSLIVAILSVLETIIFIFLITGEFRKYKEVKESFSEENIVVYQTHLIVRSVMCTISLILCIMLIYGTIKKSRKMLKGYVILKAIECVLVLLLCCKMIYQLVTAPSEWRGILGGVLAVGITELVLCCFFWLVVWSYYLQLRDEEEEAARRNIPKAVKLSDVNASSNC